MINIIGNDKDVFEGVLRAYENARKGGEDSSAAAVFMAEMQKFADFAGESDVIQKVFLVVENQILRSNRPEQLTSAMMLFLLIGTEIGAQLYKQRGESVFQVDGPMVARSSTEIN